MIQKHRFHDLRLSCGLFALTFALCLAARVAFGGSPAARLGDATNHGGFLTSGSATVRIESLPAARLGDSATCPLFTGPVPHVGGPIVGGFSATVLIQGVPAARVGSVIQETSAVSVIASGAGTVLIGP
jgi:uncharacterized Zn-binding protein involved in type VI secretion